ncbi:hypothetical protein [Desulfovibrio litoralis]|uniref:Uncharacterized protein n=1 Tax=Desulfovibrio litoralis DSM 11393 TaxID=1121455 RepID=A0A1M7RYS1_9BACT|nr:hypothetical protein [Desulfovibrio litoralis]SHN51284.1 hypothetical protein SAMN02745728_00335 [Desulfovibrio litoralis DSM 11393]
MINSISNNPADSLHNMLRSLKKEQEQLSENTVMDPIINENQIDSSHTNPNLMSNNFVSVEREQSKYIEATLTGMKANQKTNDAQQSTLTSILNTAKLEYESAKTAGERYKAIKRAEKRMALYQSDEIRKSAEKTHLKESKEKLEEQAREAILPNEGTRQSSKEVPSENPEEVVQMPEISETDSPPTIDVPVSTVPSIKIIV